MRSDVRSGVRSGVGSDVRSAVGSGSRSPLNLMRQPHGSHMPLVIPCPLSLPRHEQ